MRVVFSKYNRERRPEFQTETVITRDGGGMVVRKRALTKEAEPHVKALYETFLLLERQYGGIRVAEAAPCAGGVCFEYIRGRRVDQILMEAIIARERVRFFDTIVQHIKFIKDLGTVHSDEPGEKDVLARLFGPNLRWRHASCSEIANIDLTFDNVIVNGSGEKVLIDYEWVFDFPIPVNYLVFRSIHYFDMKYGEYLRDFVTLQEMFDFCGISQEELAQYRTMEQSFIDYVYGPQQTYRISHAYLKGRKKLTDIMTGCEEIDRTAEAHALEEKVHELENRLHAVLTSKTWQIGQLYGKLLGVSSPFRRWLTTMFTGKTGESLPKTDTISLQRTKDHWGKEAGTWQVGRGIFWLEHEAVQRRINEKVSGDPGADPIQYLMRFMSEKGYTFPVERCLTLGCGAGNLERKISQYDFCLHHDAFDLAEGAIERARSEAERRDLHCVQYEVRNINEIHLQENRYDVVFGSAAVHHFEKLEHIFSEVNKALKPEGIFFLNEYIGPSRFQWTDRQLEVMNAVLRILPKKYKMDVTNPAVWKETCVRQPVEEVIAFDPTEAIRSAEIVSLMKRYFHVVEIKETGGAILHSLLTNIAGNFKIDDRSDMKLLRLLFDLEDVLMETGDLSSDFAVIIAMKHR